MHCRLANPFRSCVYVIREVLASRYLIRVVGSARIR